MKKRAEELLKAIDKSNLLSEADRTDLFKEDSIENNKASEGTERLWKTYPQVTGLRHWSTPFYTRVAVDVEGKIAYRQKLLKKDPSIEKPERLYLDLYPARLALGTSPLTIQDGLLRGARIGQFNGSTVRLVLDIESIKGYLKYFSWKIPSACSRRCFRQRKNRCPTCRTSQPGKETFFGPAVGIGG